ncbi:hypothetical protein BDP27DRAFT_1329459 [Rhodocollybia butyracea]|uniref:Uncharacterized protein n=1 Tax=Rhodocollybia butyracea TaxID=206335 RepID=A0A9P5PNC4_9AGAR|nr:hypothetical protein BDP27DRAFT_1329459 [Rhodocollybia butyracea]
MWLKFVKADHGKEARVNIMVPVKLILIPLSTKTSCKPSRYRARPTLVKSHHLPSIVRCLSSMMLSGRRLVLPGRSCGAHRRTGWFPVPLLTESEKLGPKRNVHARES